MSSIADAIQDKCLAFGDRVIKLSYDCEELVKVLTHRCKKLDGVE